MNLNSHLVRYKIKNDMSATLSMSLHSYSLRFERLITTLNIWSVPDSWHSIYSWLNPADRADNIYPHQALSSCVVVYDHATLWTFCEILIHSWLLISFIYSTVNCYNDIMNYSNNDVTLKSNMNKYECW